MGKFLLVGASGVAVNLGALFLLVRFTTLHYAFASPVAIELSILNNYLGNRLWTWRDRRVGWDSLLHFHGVSLVGMLLQWIVLVAVVEGLGMHYLVASLFGIVAGTAWNLLGHHHFTFAHRDSLLRQRLRRPLLYATSLLIQLVLAALFVHAWDGFVFERSVENLLLHHEPPYATIEEPPAYVYNRAYVPPFPEWYAYPPLPLLVFSLAELPYYAAGASNDLLHRVLWKLPILGACLALPWVARRVALAHGARPRLADRLELFLLYNPFLFVIGPMWGMTEPILLSFLLGSLLSLSRGRILLSGALWGLGALVKIFPLFLYPLVLAHLTTLPQGWRKATRHLVAAAGVWILVSLPFALVHPAGFLNLTFVMHVQRPPAGFSLFVPLRELLVWTSGVDAADGAGALFSVVGLTVFLLFLFGASLRIHHAAPNPRRLPFRLALVFLAFLLTNKVVNEQYLLILVPLLALAGYQSAPHALRLRRAAHALSLAAAAGTLLEGFRLFQLLPRDVAPHVLGTTPAQFIVGIRQALGLSHAALLGITGTAAVALLIVAALPLFPLLGREARLAAGQLAQVAMRLPLPKAPHPLRRTVSGLLLAALVTLPSASVGLWANAGPEPPRPLAPLGKRVLGAYYYLWWENPSNDFQARYGNWAYAATTPQLGYYSSYPGEISGAVQSMQEAGIDFALVPLQGYDHTPLDVLAYHSERAGFRFSPLFDLSAVSAPETRLVQAQPQPLPLAPESVSALKAYINQYSARAYQSPNLLQLNAGRPTVFLQGARLLGDPTQPAEALHVASYVAAARPASLLDLAVGNDSWTRDPEVLTPAHFANASDPQLLARFWNEARQQAHADAWKQVLDALDRRLPGAQLVLSARDLSAPGFPLELVADTFDAWQDVRPGGPGAPPLGGFRTLYPQYEARLVRPNDPVVPALRPEGLAYAHQWSEHASRTRLLIRSWNEHQEGTALEPTVEWGDRFADATRRWSTVWRAQGWPDPIP